MSNRAEIQDSQYAFPYHYLPTLGSDGFSETRHLFWGYEYASYLEYILDLLGEKPFSSYLDIGCGEGRLTHEVHKKFPNARVLGTDFSERAIAFAQAFTPDVSFETTRNEVLIAQGRTFDRITLVEVLEHIPPEEIPHSLPGFRHY